MLLGNYSNGTHIGRGKYAIRKKEMRKVGGGGRGVTARSLDQATLTVRMRNED